MDFLRREDMFKLKQWIVPCLIILISFAGSASALSESESSSEITTAEKLENLKKDVLSVNRDLFILEEDLLFPASTQVAVYLSMDIGQFFSLDNVKLKIDDKDVTHYLYTENDTKALLKGAIQKLYVGNLSVGEHEVVAIVIGTGPYKRDFRKAVAFKFTKDSEASALEIQIRDDETKQQPKLNVIEW
ncbi:AraC family transcriptional regulator [Aliikangiella sp. IMCC44653]